MIIKLLTMTIKKNINLLNIQVITKTCTKIPSMYIRCLYSITVQIPIHLLLGKMG